MIDVTNELGPMLDAENVYIEGIVRDLGEFDETLSEKAIRDLRMGFRTKQLVDLCLKRLRSDRVVKEKEPASVTQSAPLRTWKFDRFVNGKLMVEGAKVKAFTEAEALEKAKRLFRGIGYDADEIASTFKLVTQSAPCPECGGKGKVYIRTQFGSDGKLHACPTCKGTGVVKEGKQG